MPTMRSRFTRGLLAATLLGSLACHDTEAPANVPGGPLPTAGSAGHAGGSAVGGGGASGQGGGPVGVDAKGGVRLVNLLAGAPSLDVTWGGQTAWSGLTWPSTAPVQEQALGGVLAVLSGGQVVTTASPSLAAAQDTQVAVLGQVGGPTQVLSLSPSDRAGPRVRVVHAAVPLHEGSFQILSSQPTVNTTLAFGQASDWIEVAPGSSPLWSLRVSTDARDASFEFPTPITRPTTLYVASSTEADLFVYAVADDGSTFHNGPPPSKTSVSLNHLAAGVGPTSFTIDNQPVGGGTGTIGWGEQIVGLVVPPHVAEVRAVAADGTAVASAVYPLDNLAQVSFTLVGGPGGTSLVPVFEDWSYPHKADPLAPHVTFLDARPASVGPATFSTWRSVEGWSDVGAVAPMTPTPLTLAFADQLLGLDLDQDGDRDLRFRAVFSPSGRTSTFFSVAPDGTPWLWFSAYGSSGWTLPFEFTAVARVLNLTGGLLSFSVPAAGAMPGSSEVWTGEVVPGQLQARSLLRGERTVTVGDTALKALLAPLADTTLVALPGGAVVEVATPTQVEDRTGALRLVNVSAETMSARLDDAIDLGSLLGPHQQGPSTAGGQKATVTRADGTLLTYRLPATAPGATTLLLYGGEPAWPTVRVVAPGGDVEEVHADELTAELDVVAVLPDGQSSALRLDDEATDTKSGWGTWKGTGFRYARRPLPTGAHVLHVGKAPAAIDVPVTMTAGTITRVFVLPDQSSRVLTSPAESTDVTVLSVAQASEPSDVLLLDGKDEAHGVLASGLTFGTWTTAPFPGEGLVPAVDVGGDGQADWRSYLGVRSAGVVLVIGHDQDQAVVCVKGGWAGVVGGKVP